MSIVLKLFVERINMLHFISVSWITWTINYKDNKSHVCKTSAMVRVRKVEASDKARWMELFRGYIVFYEADIPAEQYELTWNRLMDPNYESHEIGRAHV